MDFFSYQADKTKHCRPRKAEPAREEGSDIGTPTSIEVEELTLTDTFVGRLREDIRKLWNK